ncbi:inosine-uridine preferring nucleoside hydrolase [Xylaria arbuscula]|nr:inosine-uridine preferring nucleoside hydrolase [Xylaria arbuscula]
MAPKNRVIIDTDPGVDDTLALLLALASSPEEVEVVMLSVSYGNIPLEGYKEMNWRHENGKPQGFEVLRKYKPLVALGPEHALEEELLAKDGFHGRDGLHSVHEAHPHLTPADTWKSLFKDQAGGETHSPSFYSYFTPSNRPAHLEILRILKEEPEDTISICVIGPLTNLAMAAAEDPATFLRVKEVVVMGGAVDCPGNITPVAEFNTYADAIATARVFALTSIEPASTMPTTLQCMSNLPSYPDQLSKRLRLSLFPLDLTTSHLLRRDHFIASIKPHVEAGSPLAIWVNTFMNGTFRQIEKLSGGISQKPGLQLHDPMVIWYIITQHDSGWSTSEEGPEDIRIETSGQWSRGMHIRDRRGFKKAKESLSVGGLADASSGDVQSDDYGWLCAEAGNQIHRYVSSPGKDKLGRLLINRIFGGYETV